MLFLVGLDVPQYPVFYPRILGVGELLPSEHLPFVVVQGGLPQCAFHRLLEVIPGHQVVVFHDGFDVALNGLYADAENLSDLVDRPSLDEPEPHHFLAPVDDLFVRSKLVLAHLLRLPLTLYQLSSRHR